MTKQEAKRHEVFVVLWVTSERLPPLLGSFLVPRSHATNCQRPDDGTERLMRVKLNRNRQGMIRAFPTATSANGVMPKSYSLLSLLSILVTINVSSIFIYNFELFIGVDSYR